MLDLFIIQWKSKIYEKSVALQYQDMSMENMRNKNSLGCQ
nr:MAG TPA: hypothetical protein [Bacteriophage sp.]